MPILAAAVVGSVAVRFLCRRRAHRWGIRAVLAASVLAVALWMRYAGFPDQEQFSPLTTGFAVPKEEAFVRLYVAPIPGTLGLGVHPWFVLKKPGTRETERWELFQVDGGIYGHIWKEVDPLEAEVGFGWGEYILAELRGPAAERVISFIETQSPRYPCRDFYRFVPGPNSNTYAQWVLENTGWEVDLPPSAVGASWVFACR